ncbi:MAG: hypothetical protein GC172_09620 [Phycisphaera sp.]|nr:hypothetical protein [Phycisphaera sp.]
MNDVDVDVDVDVDDEDEDENENENEDPTNLAESALIPNLLSRRRPAFRAVRGKWAGYRASCRERTPLRRLT